MRSQPRCTLIRPVATAILGCLLLALAGCNPGRQERSGDEHRQMLRDLSARNAQVVDAVRARMLRALQADLDAGRPPCLDILLLSGGADWGAFGTGFLRAWSEVPADDAAAMPRFDVITGISTGALIAPYALLGEFARVDGIYRGSDPGWARRDVIFGFFTGHGFYDISRLEERLRASLDQHLRPGLLAAAAEDRSLIIATTDLDCGMLRLWDLLAAAEDAERAFRIQRAAIAIPGAFDPIELDGSLHADAGVLKGVFTTPQPHRLAGMLAQWRAEHPEHPARIRYWAILNNRVYDPPVTVQPTWRRSVERSLSLMLRSGLIAPLYALWLQARELNAAGHDVQFRWVGVPPDFPIDTSRDMFDPATTQALSDLGRRIAQGADPWHVQAPAYTRREVEDGSAPADDDTP